jgi:hypothetical protein
VSGPAQPPSSAPVPGANATRRPVGKHRFRRRVAWFLAGGTLAAAAALGAGAVLSPQLTHCVVRGALPDPRCTPGVRNPSVTQSNIQQTICVSGFTATIRPPVSYTDPLKAELMRTYNLPGLAGAYEFDHLIPLEVGGDPVSTHNLWPESYTPGPGAHEKDKVENYLHEQVCSGQVTLADAQTQIATDWLSVWNRIKP